MFNSFFLVVLYIVFSVIHIFITVIFSFQFNNKFQSNYFSYQIHTTKKFKNPTNVN